MQIAIQASNVPVEARVVSGKTKNQAELIRDDCRRVIQSYESVSEMLPQILEHQLVEMTVPKAKLFSGLDQLPR